MSYEVTATRRRPQQFDDLVGQEFVAATLKNSIKSGKIAHAYLFSGPRGCGKTSTARILAKALNCQNGPTETPCGTCSNCQEIIKGASLDVIEIDGASNNSVENVRQIKDEIQFPPTSSKYKVYIIDEVHMLSGSAFNALLKTIEEPPEYVVFIFATTELQKVPATIKSRCQQYNFRLVAIDKVKECLADAARELNVQADDEALFWIARESTGSMRDAYTLFDQVVAFSDGHITYEKIRDKLGLVGIDRLNTIFENCAAGKTTEVLACLDEFLQNGVSIEQLISNSADYLRSLLLIKSGVTKEALLGNSVERYSKAVLDAWTPIQIERGLSIFLQLYRDIRYSLSQRYEIELTFSRICWLKDYVSNMEVKKAVDAAQKLLVGVTPAAASVTAAPVTTSAPVMQAAQEIAPAPAQDAPQSSAPVSKAPFDGMLNQSFAESQARLQANQGEQPDPFSNGGPLPPQQSVEAGNAFSVSGSGYTDNPDDPDDGWTNTDDPPPDDYYSEQLQEEEAQASYEESQNNAQQKVQQPVQLDEHFLTQDGRDITIAQLRGTVIAELSITEGVLASTLEKTGLWKISENKVETTVDSEFELQMLKRNIPSITEQISKVCGKKMEFGISLKQAEQPVEEAPKEVPVQVDVLVKAFRGTVVVGN